MFELYKKTRAASDEETVNISSAGVITFSPAVTKQHLEGVEFVELYFDSSAKRVGVRPVKKSDYGYQVFKTGNGKRAAISGRGFLRNYRIIEESGKGKFKAYGPAETKFSDGMIIFSVK